ncbi:FkbM family methyltransferase [Patescibacteria group bacterium]|nr:FkbM family methyltransferase [Patescibacteria group bacterium]
MQTIFSKIHGYEIGYTNKEEFNILKDEIFNKEIYNIDIDLGLYAKKNYSPVIFDLGAHIGLSILYFKIKYPNSKIIAFEPNPNIFPILEENIECNGLENIELHNIALGNRDEVRVFYIDNSGNDSFSTGSFSKDAWNGTQISIPINVTCEKLSKYITSNIDILKVDIEGTETEVLKELVESDKLKYIQNILIEYHPTNNGNPKNLLKLLNENGFETKTRADEYGTTLINILAKNISKESA